MRALPMHPHPHLRAFIKWALLAMIVLFAARAVHAEVAKIVQTYTAPGGAPRGIAWDGSNVWLVDDIEKLYKLDPATFATISWCSVGGYDRSGLTWDGSYLWTVNDGSGMDKIDGSCGVLDSNSIGYWSYSGAAWGGGYLWIVDYNFGTCYQLNPDGSEVRHWTISWPTYGSHATGVFHDGTNVWIGDSGRFIGKFNTTGTRLFSIDLSTDLGLTTAYGLVEFTWDPNYLWVSLSGGFYVYKVAVCGTIAFAPTSLPPASNGAYSQSLSATGERGTSPFTFAVTAGSLPPGLTLDANGLLSGVATSEGTYNFTVTSTGANTCTATKDYALTVVFPPSLSGVTPTSGPLTGGTNVTITGTSLGPVNSVTFGGVAATSFAVVNPTMITATTPPHSAGAVDVVVNTPLALSATLPAAFTYIDPPSVTSISPTSGLTTGGTSVTITGSHFTSGATVKFGSAAATNVAVVNATTITATTPASVPGVVTVKVTNPDGQMALLPAAFSYLSPPGNNYYVNGTTGSNTTSGGTLAAPWKTITYSLTRITGFGHTLHVAAGTYDTTLGETFPIMVKNGVSLSGAGAGTTTIDAKGTNVVLKAVGISDPGTTIQNFTIRGGGNSNEGGGIFVTAGSMLKVTNNLVTANFVSSSTSGRRYGGGIYVLNSSPSIIGNDIAANTVEGTQAPTDPDDFGAYGGGIAISGSSSTPIIRQNTIRGNVAQNYPGAIAYGAGVCVVNQAAPTIDDNTITGNELYRLYATSGTTLGAGVFTLNSYPVISRNTIAGNTLSAGYGSLTASSGIYVEGFSPTISRNVIANNQDHGIVCASSTATITNNTIVGNSAAGIILADASPEIVNNIFYGNTTYGIEESTFSSDPLSARYNLFFANGAGVYRDEAATDYFSASTLDTSVTECKNNLEGDPYFVDAGNGDYHVYQGSPVIDGGDPASEQDPDGSRADIGALPFALTAPTITSITPSAGTTAGGTPFTITGANFAAGASVRLGSAIATNVSVVSDTLITAVTASAAPGVVDVVVTNIDGLRGTLAGGFTYVSSPGYTSLAPTVGPAAGGTSVTITGVNLTGVISVAFGGSDGTITGNTSTSVTVTTPAHAAGTVDVVINAAGGSVTATAAFTYMAAPTVTSITPNRGPTAGGTSVVIAGTNLADVTSVVFGGVAGAIVSKNATSLTATTPAHAAESSVWRAEAQITEFTGDGLQGVSITGARDSLGFPIPSGDKRFGFEIVTSGTSSFELQADGGPGRIDLTWVASTLDTLAGYNLYRATVSGGPYTKVNASLVAQTSYTDFTVTPNVPYYYVYRVVNTSLEEASDSNEASATATDASAPVITHTPMTTATAGVPITIIATITDNVGVDSASVFYRALGATIAFTQVAMINATGSQYTANIPAAAVVAPGVEYYIEASDGFAISRHGSAAAPHVVTIAASGGVAGDANGDGSIGPDDVAFLVNYFFGNGPAPGTGGDANGDHQLTIADLFYLINYLFSGGPPP